MLVDLEQPGAGTITVFGSAMKAAWSDIRPRGPAPDLGEHDRWFLEELLGKDPSEVDRILASWAMG